MMEYIGRSYNGGWAEVDYPWCTLLIGPGREDVEKITVKGTDYVVARQPFVLLGRDDQHWSLLPAKKVKNGFLKESYLPQLKFVESSEYKWLRCSDLIIRAGLPPEELVGRFWSLVSKEPPHRTISMILDVGTEDLPKKALPQKIVQRDAVDIFSGRTYAPGRCWVTRELALDILALTHFKYNPLEDPRIKRLMIT